MGQQRAGSECRRDRVHGSDGLGLGGKGRGACMPVGLGKGGRAYVAVQMLRENIEWEG